VSKGGRRRIPDKRVHRLGVSEKAIRKLIGPSKPAESAQIAFTGITAVAMGAPLAQVIHAPSHLDRAGVGRMRRGGLPLIFLG
jgi:hypothetical protein